MPNSIIIMIKMIPTLLFIFLCLTNGSHQVTQLTWTNKYNKTDWNNLMKDYMWENVFDNYNGIDTRSWPHLLYLYRNHNTGYEIKIINKMLDIIDDSFYKEQLLQVLVEKVDNWCYNLCKIDKRYHTNKLVNIAIKNDMTCLYCANEVLTTDELFDNNFERLVEDASMYTWLPENHRWKTQDKYRRIVERNPYTRISLCSAPNPDELYFIAVQKDPTTISRVPELHLTDKILDEVLRQNPESILLIWDSAGTSNFLKHRYLKLYQSIKK